MKILITGANGYLAKSFIFHLLQNTNSILFVNTSKPHEFTNNERIRVLNINIYDTNQLSNSVNDDVDVILHFSTSSYQQFESIPCDSIDHSLKILNSINNFVINKKVKKFFYFSSIHVYGTNYNLYNENSILTPNSHYAKAHLVSENIVSFFSGINHDCNYYILRLSNVFGMNTSLEGHVWKLFFPDIIKQAYKTGTILLNTNGMSYRDFLTLSDFCNILNSLVFNQYSYNRHDNLLILNVNSGYSQSLKYYADLVKDVVETKTNKNISIHINTNDKIVYKNTLFCNSRLKNLNIKINNLFNFEIERIINYLSNS